MPANFDRDFALWLTQHGSERAVAVNVLQFSHPGFVGDGAGNIYVSDYGEVFQATDENSVQFIAQPLGFVIEIAADTFTTEQRLVIRLDNANGLVMNELRTLDLEDLQTPVQVIYRAYLDTRRAAPATDPITLYVESINGARLAVEIEASADALPNVSSGIRYTLDRFPMLAYL